MSIYIKKQQNSLTIRIPVKKNPYLIFPIFILSIVWVPFLLLFVQKSLISNDLFNQIFWIGGLSTWFFVGTIGVTFLIWMLFGYEEIKIQNDWVVVSKPLVFYVRNNFYETNTIKAIRLDKELYKARKNGVWLEKTRNIIRMETPSKTVGFARGIDSQDGETIVINMASCGLLDQNQFQIIHKA